MEKSNQEKALALIDSYLKKMEDQKWKLNAVKVFLKDMK